MTAPELTRWITSSYSGSNGGDCVEAAFAARSVGIRDSKDRDAGHLVVASSTWNALLVAVNHPQPGIG